MLKLKMMLCVMMLPLVIVGYIKAVCQSVREATTASGVDNTASPTGRHRERDYFTSEERLITMQKQLEGDRSILMSSADRVALSMGNSCNYCEQYTRAVRYKLPKVIKPSNPFTNVCWVSVLTTFSAPPQILAASTVFFYCQFQKRRNDG